MNCHLVTVEVSVEGATSQRVKLNCLTFNELRLEGLNTQAVQRRCTVQQHGVLTDDVVEDVPHLGALAFNLALCSLHILSEVLLNQALHDEGLEEFQSHLLGQTTLMKLQLRADDDNGTTRVVDALTQKVLTETTLLTLEHVRDRLQRTVTGACNGAATTSVIEERVN